MNWKLILILILLLVLVIFAAQNYEIVEIKFLLWSFQTSRAIIIFSTLAIGFIVGWASHYLKEK
ncbi:MAG: LapA family protein [Candidatus Omnitrophica bacterium]|nr:LapA family protein [Candidatus Omnitrophota bacterium]